MNFDDVSYFLKNDIHAIRFFKNIIDISHFWDDLIDKDKPIQKEQINNAMWSVLIELPSNPFYQKYFNQLQATMQNAIANWMAANEFENGSNEKDLSTAYIIRSDYANILIQCAYLIGGKDWMFEVAPKIRSAWTTEDFADYKINLSVEKTARQSSCR